MRLLEGTIWRLLVPIMLGVILYLQTYILHYFEDMEFGWDGILMMIFPVIIVFEVTRWVNHYFRKQHHTLLGLFWTFLICFVICFLIVFAMYVPLKLAEIRNGAQDSIGHFHVFSIGSQILFMTMIAFAFYQIQFLIKKWQEEAIRATRLEKENISAKLATLQSQISPHFLFNNFNTLYGLVEHQPQQAKIYIQKLATLYRQVLAKKNEELIPLQNELATLKDYLYLLDVRFGKTIIPRLQFEHTSSFFIPPMTLQILVENAIKHNRFDEEQPLYIDLLQMNNKVLVKNNKQLQKSVESSNGVGLQNIQNRYTLLSDENILIQDTAQAFEVTIPLLQISN